MRYSLKMRRGVELGDQLFIVILFSLCALPISQAQQTVTSKDQSSPLSVSDIEHGLKAGVTKTRMAALIKQYGVDFELTDAIQKELRAAGADGDLLLVVSRSKTPSPPSGTGDATNTSSGMPSTNKAGATATGLIPFYDARDCVGRGVTPAPPGGHWPVVRLQNVCLKPISVYFCWVVNALPDNGWSCSETKIDAGKSTTFNEMDEAKMSCTEGHYPGTVSPDESCSHFIIVWNATYQDSGQRPQRPNVPTKPNPTSR